MSQEDKELMPRWYVIHTYSGYENKVKTDLEKTIKNRELEEYFFDIIVPMEEQIEIKEGKRKTNLKKVFPGYVLIKMIVTEKTWYIVRNTRGVTGFVGSGTDPIPLTEEEIRNMGFEITEVNVDYNVNDSVDDEMHEQLEYERMQKKMRLDDLSWLKVYAYIGLERYDDAKMLLEQIRKVPGEYKEKADSLYNVMLNE